MGSLIFGPYNVTDVLTSSTFSSSFPLKPGWKRVVKVDVPPTDNIAGKCRVDKYNNSMPRC
jgi:hypothetical protein